MCYFRLLSFPNLAASLNENIHVHEMINRKRYSYDSLIIRILLIFRVLI